MIFGSLSLSGCYTQLAMFYPDPEVEEEEYQSYSVARVRPNLSLYANDGAGQSLGMAYQLMYNRFYGGYGSGYYNKYDYYNRYGYHAGYNSYNIAGYKMYIPQSDNKTPRNWSRDSKSSGTNLTVTRTRTNTNESTNNGDYSNSSSITRSTSSGTSTNSSSNGGGRRVTKRH